MTRAKRAPAFQPPRDEAEIVRLEPPTVAPIPKARRRRAGERSEADLPSYRIGCTHFGAWINDPAARQFKAMAMERGVTIREAFVEMLNGEFARRGRPTIAE